MEKKYMTRSNVTGNNESCSLQPCEGKTWACPAFILELDLFCRIKRRNQILILLRLQIW